MGQATFEPNFSQVVRGYLSFQITREEVDDIAYMEGFDEPELGKFGSSILVERGFTIWGYPRVYGTAKSHEAYLQYLFEKSVHVNDPPKRL